MKQDYDPSVERGCTVSTMSLPVFILWFLTVHDRYDRHLLHSSPASGELYIQPSTIESVERVQFKLEGNDFSCCLSQLSQNMVMECVSCASLRALALTLAL